MMTPRTPRTAADKAAGHEPAKAKRRTRRKAMARVGAVRVYSPVPGERRFRMVWIDPLTGKQGGTSAGTDHETAMARAAEKNLEVEALLAGVRREDTIGALVDDFLKDGQGRGQEGSDASEGRMSDLRRHLQRATAEHRSVRLATLHRAELDTMRAQAGTKATVRENTTALRLLLQWGASTGRLSPTTGDLLGERVRPIKPARPSRATASARKRRQTPRKAGSSAVGDAPTLEALKALREHVQRIQPRWGALAVELAAACGTRWGEQFQLTAYDVLETAGGLEIAINWQINGRVKACAIDRRKLPKGEKVRVTTVPTWSQTAFPLAQTLRGRRDAALAEKAAGTNPEALLFCSPTGRLYIHTNFATNVFKPAAIAANWPYQAWDAEEEVKRKDGTVERVVRHRVQFDWTWHSLRHRYARFAVDILRLTPAELTVQGGWEDVEIVNKRYYKTGDEHRESSREKVHAIGTGQEVTGRAVAPTTPGATPTHRSIDQLRLDLIERASRDGLSFEVYERLAADLDRIERSRLEPSV